MYKIEFSILSYYLSILTKENINVGLLFQNMDTDETIFYIMNNWNRLQSFDDELDIKFMKKYLTGMKNECEKSLFNINNDKKFSLKEYISYYVNELQFSNIIEANITNIREFIDNTEKVYMKFDFNKHERLSSQKELKFMKMLMKSNNINYSSKSIIGKFNENVQYDFMVNKYGFKNFIFENKNISRQISTAKAWAYTANKLKNNYKTIFVYDIEKLDSSNYTIIMKILKENAYKVIPSTDVLVCAKNLQNEKHNQSEKDFMLEN